MFKFYTAKEVQATEENIDNEFNEIAEMYFQNYLEEWCSKNHIDDSSQSYIIDVLSDYSAFLFDALVHNISGRDNTKDELKN